MVVAKVIWALPYWGGELFPATAHRRKKMYSEVPQMCLLDGGAYANAVSM